MSNLVFPARTSANTFSAGTRVPLTTGVPPRIRSFDTIFVAVSVFMTTSTNFDPYSMKFGDARARGPSPDFKPEILGSDPLEGAVHQRLGQRLVEHFLQLAILAANGDPDPLAETHAYLRG